MEEHYPGEEGVRPDEIDLSERTISIFRDRRPAEQREEELDYPQQSDYETDETLEAESGVAEILDSNELILEQPEVVDAEFPATTPPELISPDIVDQDFPAGTAL